MSIDSPGGAWSGDAISLVDAFRRRELHPTEAIKACLAAIESSPLNAFCHLDTEAALARAAQVDLELPLAGVPFGVKEIEAVAGWPFADASIPLRHRRAGWTSTNVARLLAAGAIPIGQTTSSELARNSFTATRLHGVTRNPWDPGLSPGGSSGGSAAAVAGGLVPVATATDGGGSTRQPAALCGLPGLKVTWRIIPAGPRAIIEPLTVVVTALTRSIRDLARLLDVTVGFDSRDPFSAAVTAQFEAGLGTVPVAGRRVAFCPGFGGARPGPDAIAAAELALDELVSAAGLVRVADPEVILNPPDERFGSIAALRLRRWLGPYWPGCADELTDDVRAAVDASYGINLESLAQLDAYRTETIEAVADLFEEVDLVATPTTAGEAFPAEGPDPAGSPNGLWPANLTGLPAISIPAGTGPGGLPLGLQLVGRHHDDAVLLELAHRFEQLRPWPLTAPTLPT